MIWNKKAKYYVIFFSVFLFFQFAIVYGATCFGIEDTDPLICSSNGVCVEQDICICDVGWAGSDCSTPVCSACVNGDCVAPETCICDSGWTGADCSSSTGVSLYQGWNLAASPYDTIVNSTTALASIEGCYKGIFSFFQGIWGIIAPGNPFSNIDVIRPDRGYWIKVNCSEINWQIVVLAENCTNGYDDDLDEDIDCDDDDCLGDPGCLSLNGAPCNASEECLSGLCLDEASTTWPGGFCTDDCSSSSCDVSEECVNFGGQMYCLLDCTMQIDCRSGYSCWDAYSPNPICWPDCLLDAECPTNGICNPWSGYCTSLQGLSQDGEACTTNSDCESSFCLDERYGWPGGYCTNYCALSENNCPGDSLCMNFGFTLFGICFDGCNEDFDCRQAEGYTCQIDVCRPA